MRMQVSRLALAMASRWAIVALAGCSALAAAVAPSGRALPSPPQDSQPVPGFPPLVIDTIVVDKKGALVEDLRAADLEILVAGKRRIGVTIARLYRGPGAAALAAARQVTPLGEAPALAEPSRVVVLVVDQASLLQGDERRARAIVENCIGLLGLGDRIMVLTLPDLAGSTELSADREAIRPVLGRIRALRGMDPAAIAAEAAEAARPLIPSDRPREVVEDPERAETPPGRATERAELPGRLEDLMPRDLAEGAETLSAEATRAHAVETLAGLSRLVGGLGAVPGAKTVVLFSAGLVIDDARRELQTVTTLAFAARARIYSVQVPTPARRFAASGRAGLVTLAQTTGGALVTLADKPAQALQRMVAELSSSYLVMLTPEPTDFEAGLRTIEVRSKRKDLTIRCARSASPGQPPVVVAAAPPPPPAPSPKDAPVAPPAGAARTPWRPDPTLDAALARATDYVTIYERELSAVVAEEVYEQKISHDRGPKPRSIRLVSDFLLVQVPGVDGWMPFRDVFEVDGTPVRDRGDRLQKLFLEAPPAAAVANANKIWDESARYNLGVHRNINVPTLALLFLNPENRSRFTFRRRGEETIGGVRAWVVEYRELRQPTIIKTSQGDDVEASGRFWVEPVSGRIVQSLLQASVATITVAYGPRGETPGLWLPVTMEEKYRYPGTRIDAVAAYSRFRRFQVFTEEKITIPKT